MKTSSTHSYCCDDDNEILNIDANKNESYMIDGGDSFCRKRIAIPSVSDNEDDEGDEDEDDDMSENEYESDNERRLQQYHLKRIGMGVRECDAMLEAVASV
ncbi:hypothetical protein PVAND_012586 [Polypedilum vanderplanki]|uniref:Uncharacterized protein n=1 Tax=Polypedilum vanderplanki TaxID=319348 RepID=A0A9J6CNT7_POLVA|nr:hypothetical protein PVAND_012586 [Polypedilum vanderplanki]